MFFNTYKTDEVSMEDIISRLKIPFQEYNCNDYINEAKVKLIWEAILNSNNNACASRYGLTDIRFAETELLNALDRKGKEVEFLNYRYDFKDIPMNHKKSIFPMVLAIEPSSICNLKCNMCFQNNKNFTENPANMGVMEWELYEKILGQIKEGQLYSVVFASRGEPLVNKNIHKMIELAKKKGVMDVKLNTNAVLLTEDLSRKLLESGLDQIVFSVDSAIPEHYEDIRGTNFEKVSKNIKRFCEIRRNEFKNMQIKTRISMVINDKYKDDLEHEVEVARKFWKGTVDEIAYKSQNDFCGVYDDITVDNKKCCDLLWERLYIWQDGTINPCDIDHLSTLKLGNIKETNIRGVWNGEQMELLRKMHLNSRNEMKCVCAHCVGY